MYTVVLITLTCNIATQETEGGCVSVNWYKGYLSRVSYGGRASKNIYLPSSLPPPPPASYGYPAATYAPFYPGHYHLGMSFCN